MKKIFSGISLFALVVLYGGRAVVGYAQDAAAPGSADQAAQQAPDQTGQSADANAGQDFSADVNTGEQQLAQDPNADMVQVSIVNAEDQSAGDPTNSDIPLFTSIDQAQVDSQSNEPDGQNNDLTTSEVTQEVDANNLSADTQTIIDDQQQQDQQAQDQQAQDQQNQDQSQQQGQTQQQDQQGQDQTQQQDQSQQSPDQSQQTTGGDTSGGTGQ